LTVFAISTYLFARLIVLVRAEGRGGVSTWTGEAKLYFIQSKTSAQRDGRNAPDTSFEALSTSVVMVEGNDYQKESVEVESIKVVKDDGVKIDR
jgi:hypothetical protein